MLVSLVISGTPDNGLKFRVVHAKNVRHKVWLILLPTGTNCSIVSAVHEEGPFMKRLHKPLTPSLCCHNDQSVIDSIAYLMNYGHFRFMFTFSSNFYQYFYLERSIQFQLMLQ